MIDRRSFVALGAVVVAGTAAADAAAKELKPLWKVAEDAVDAALQAQTEAWNRGDLVAFCSFYADDAVFVSPSGVTRGRAEVLARYQKRYGGNTATMGTLSFERVDVRSSAEAVSLAMRWKLVWADKPEASGHTLIVWRKINDQWKLVQDASM